MKELDDIILHLRGARSDIQEFLDNERGSADVCEPSPIRGSLEENGDLLHQSDVITSKDFIK